MTAPLSPPPARLTDRHAVLLLILITPLAFWNTLLDPARCLQEDIAFEWHGLHAAADEQIALSRFPHWNPYTLGGVRLFADTYLGLLYPGSFLFRLLPFTIACVASWLLHYIATALATYALARSLLRVQPAAALIAAWLFALGGFSLGHCNHLNFVFALPWMPLLLLSLHHLRNGRPRWFLVGSLCVALMLLAGGAPILLMTLVAAALLWIFPLLRDLRARKIDRTLPPTVYGVLMVALGVGLAAVQLLPTMDYYAASVRSTWNIGRLSWGSLAWRTLLYQMASPHLLGNLRTGLWGGAGHETLFFIGGIGTALAAVGACCVRRHRWVAPLLLMFGVSIILAHGNNPAARLFSAAVGRVANFREPSRFICLTHLAAALLAALGFQHLMSRSKFHYHCPRRAAMFCAVAVTATTLMQHLRLSGLGNTVQEAIAWKQSQPPVLRDWLANSDPAALLAAAHRPAWVLWAMSLSCAGGFLVYMHGFFRTRRAATLIVLVFMELLLFGAGTWAGQPRMAADADPNHPIIDHLSAHLGRERFAAPDDYIPLRGNRGAPFRLANQRGYMGNSLNVSTAHDAFFRALGDGPPGSRLFSTRYAVTRAADGDGPVIAREGDWALRENADRLPLAVLVPHTQTADVVAALQFIQRPDFDPRAIAVVAGNGLAGNVAPLDPSETCEIKSWPPDDVHIVAHCRAPRWLLIGISHDAGWSANVDGQPAPLVRTNVCFNGLPLPAGAHDIRLTYHTPRLALGAIVSIASLIAWILVWRWLGRQDQSRK